MTASALTRPGERDRLTVKLTQIDWPLVLVLCMIAGSGAAMLYSLAGGSWDQWAAAHLIRFGVFAVIMLVLGLVDLRVWFAVSYPIYGVALLLLIWFWPGERARRNLRQWAVINAAAAAVIALGVNQVIIRLWDRPRPFMSHPAIMLLTPSRDPSFPSDHATFAFGIAVALVLALRRAGIAALLLAVLISFARVYTGEHYVSDVLGGALVVANPELFERLYFVQNATGAVMGPLEAYLCSRGLKTLELRVREQCRTAQRLGAGCRSS